MFSKQLWFGLVFAMTLPLAAQDSSDAMQAVTKAICEPSAFVIAAHTARNCTFVVPENADAAKFDGHFTATGGPRNTIEVWVLDDDGYVNWKNHHQVQALYTSQKVTTGSIDLLLRPGKYHVVFNNIFSLITPKAVEARMVLQYKVPQITTN